MVHYIGIKGRPANSKYHMISFLRKHIELTNQIARQRQTAGQFANCSQILRYIVTQTDTRYCQIFFFFLILRKCLKQDNVVGFQVIFFSPLYFSVYCQFSGFPLIIGEKWQFLYVVLQNKLKNVSQDFIKVVFLPKVHRQGQGLQ